MSNVSCHVGLYDKPVPQGHEQSSPMNMPSSLGLHIVDPRILSDQVGDV
jgi:hypothetical protein